MTCQSRQYHRRTSLLVAVLRRHLLCISFLVGKGNKHDLKVKLTTRGPPYQKQPTVAKPRCDRTWQTVVSYLSWCLRHLLPLQAFIRTLSRPAELKPSDLRARTRLFGMGFANTSGCSTVRATLRAASLFGKQGIVRASAAQAASLPRSLC